jgi:hypothetical protein
VQVIPASAAADDDVRATPAADQRAAKNLPAEPREPFRGVAPAKADNENTHKREKLAHRERLNPFAQLREPSEKYGFRFALGYAPTGYRPGLEGQH